MRNAQNSNGGYRQNEENKEEQGSINDKGKQRFINGGRCMKNRRRRKTQSCKSKSIKF